MPPEPRRTSTPRAMSSSYPTSSEFRPRDHSVEPRMMSNHHHNNSSNSHSNNHYPPAYPQQGHYSNQPGSRSSWAGHSTAELESSFTLTSGGGGGGGSSSSSTATPYFRRSVHDPRDDYHHSPQHGTYIPPIGHQEYRTNNSSSNSLDELHHTYSQQQHQQPYHHRQREGSFSSIDHHTNPQDGYNDLYNGGRGGYDNHNNHNSNSSNSGKHRNNSVSSNASHSSSSSMSHFSGNKHPCKFPTCGWSFKRYEHLKRHMLVHSKERAFVCDYHGCEKSFSRSDNFSAHLRTHTKKSAAAAAKAAAAAVTGTTGTGKSSTAQLRRFDRDRHPQTGAHSLMAIDPIRTNFPNSSTSALMSGPMSDVPPAVEQRRSGSGGAAGGVDYSHHRHSIAGYPSFSGSRSPLQMQNIYSHGLPTPVHTNHGPNSATTRSARNSYCGPSSDDPTSSSDYEQPKSATSSTSAFSFGFALAGQHRRTPSGMHPLDSPTAATTPTNAAGGATTNSDGMSNIVPKFNTIKLDLKTVSNHTDDRRARTPQQQQQYQEHGGRQFPSPEADMDIKPSSGRQGSPHSYPYQHHDEYHYNNRYRHGHKSEGLDEPQKQRGLDRDREYDRHYDQSSASVSGYEHPNPNPNGESPVMTTRSGARHGDEMKDGPSITKCEPLMDFSASISSHFTPASSSGNDNGNTSRQDSPVMGTADVQEGLKGGSNSGRSLSSSSSNTSFLSHGADRDRRPLSSAAAHGAGRGGGTTTGRGHEFSSMSSSYQHLNGSVSPPRSNSDSYSGSAPMDEDGNPVHPQHRHQHQGYFHHHHPQQHHGGGYSDYNRVDGYPPSPHMHHSAIESSSYEHHASSSSASYSHEGEQRFNGPSSAPPSYYHHSSYHSGHPYQPYPEDSGSYHQQHNPHHGIPPMPMSAQQQQQQQQQLPPQQLQEQQRSAASSSAGTGTGGRMRGMSSSAKNHCCPIAGCMKRFKRLEHLKRHTKTHTLERPFACSNAGCNKRFSRSDNLSQHIKTHQRQLMSKIHWKQRSM
ncbi:hypothetical protein BGX33_010788 [Mortierella sp. NVP41]|nr:hypothetical protein BGX33_010788 [Mortierella sp. NVP41]